MALRRAILDRLISDPLVGTSHLRIAVNAEVVTLSGHVTSHAQKDAANAAARRVRGVGRIADEVRVAAPCLLATDAPQAPLAFPAPGAPVENRP